MPIDEPNGVDAPSGRTWRTDLTAERARPFAPPVDRDAIFRKLIYDEIRSGRLNRERRARVVRYACGMGLSARQAGELVRECAERVAAEYDGRTRRFALRLVEESPRGTGVHPAVIWGIAATVILVALILWRT